MQSFHHQFFVLYIEYHPAFQHIFVFVKMFQYQLSSDRIHIICGLVFYFEVIHQKLKLIQFILIKIH